MELQRKLRSELRNAIIEHIEECFPLDQNQRQGVISRLNNADIDDLIRLLDAFERFGAEVVMDLVVRSDKDGLI